MAPLPDIRDPFPAMPTVLAQWVPVYLEPLPGSGERLTVAVAARAGDGAFHVVRTLSAKKARCMYEDQGPSITGFVDLVIESLCSHLTAGAHLGSWQPPLRDAIAIGPVSEARGDTVQEAAHAGVLLAASLAADPALELEVVEAIQPPDDGDEWVQQIREKTVRAVADFAPRFQRRIPLREGAPPTSVGYIGDRLAAQFGRLVPGRGLTNHRNRAKAYITDLQILRDQEQSNLITRLHYELMLWVPRDESPEYTAQQRDEAHGAYAELEAFGDKHDLRVEALSDSDAATQRILHTEGVA